MRLSIFWINVLAWWLNSNSCWFPVAVGHCPTATATAVILKQGFGPIIQCRQMKIVLLQSICYIKIVEIIASLPTNFTLWKLVG